MKKLLARIWEFIGPPRLGSHSPDLRGSMASIDGSAEREAREHNQEAVARSTFTLQREALQKSLNLTYLSFMVSILAVVVALGALIVAINGQHSQAPQRHQYEYMHRAQLKY